MQDLMKLKKTYLGYFNLQLQINTLRNHSLTSLLFQGKAQYLILWHGLEILIPS